MKAITYKTFRKFDIYLIFLFKSEFSLLVLSSLHDLYKLIKEIPNSFSCYYLIESKKIMYNYEKKNLLHIIIREHMRNTSKSYFTGKKNEFIVIEVATMKTTVL